MSKKVNPVKVSPLIKGCRWSFLGLGIFYGISKLDAYKSYEESVRPKREQKIKEKYIKLRKESGLKDSKEVYNAAREFEVEEFPPGWNDEI